MMGLSSMGSGPGEGNSSSSFSNLSALAPPFTVHRLNPSPNSNPLWQYQEQPYPIEPFSHSWQYPIPSAPRHELVIGSTGVTSVPLSSNYQFSASTSICPPSTHWSDLSHGEQTSGNTFAYSGGVDPYYAPYAPPMVGEDGPLVEDDGPRYDTGPTSGLGVSPQIDYIHSLYDSEYGPQWADSLGFEHGKQSKRLELDEKLLSEKEVFGDLHIYNSEFNQGGCGIEHKNEYKENTSVLYEPFNQASQETHTGSMGTCDHMENKSFLEQNYSFLPCVSSKSHIMTSNSSNADSHSGVLSHDMHINFSNYQHTSSTHEKFVGSTDSPFTCHVSTIRSSPAVVIRQPPVVNGTFGQSVVSRTPARSDSVIGAHRGRLDHSKFSKRKDLGKKLSPEIEGNPYNTELFHLPKQDTSVLDGFDNVQAVTSTMESSDFMDHHNPAVDSPCWKGAPSSRFFSVDLEAGPSNQVKKKLDEFYGFDHEEHQNLQSVIDPTRTSSERASEANKNADYECARNDITLTLDGFLSAICPSREEILSNASKPGIRTSTLTSSVGIQTSNEPNMPRRELGLSNNLNSGFDLKISDTKHFIGEEDAGMTLNDDTEGGVIAVDAAEKVLASPSSQEEPRELSKSRPNPKLDVPTVIKAMHNLSELLLFHLSNEECTLKEEYTETLKHIRSNLDSCLSKEIVQAINEPEQNNTVGNTSKKLWESPSVATISGSPQKIDITEDSNNQLDYWDMLAERRNCCSPNNKDEKPPVLPTLGDDLDITREDDMAKAIKKVLDQNFNFNEEMHSETLLFKSLWLEAEAKLCSISYKTRFDRMKIEMEKLKPKEPKEYVAEIMSKVCISPGPCTASKLVPEAHDGTIPKASVQNSYLCTTSGRAEDVDASVIARFNILKSREDNLKSVNVEEERSPGIVGESAISVMPRFNFLKSLEDNLKSTNVEEEQSPDTIEVDSASSIMARFNILKSREDKLKSINVEEEQSSNIVDSDSVSSIMGRFNILKSLEDSLKSVNMEEEQQPEMGGVDFTGWKYHVPGPSDEPEDEILKVALRPHFLHQTSSPSEGKFGSCVDGYVYGSLEKFNLSAPNDISLVHSIDNSRMMNQHYPGWRDSSSSDWEHVLKDDVAWNNF